jgi:hypothetical protein
MNLIVSGTGLILLGRPWLGLALAVWFTLGIEAALCGGLVAPAAIPSWLTWLASASALAGWVMAQVLLVMRIRLLSDPNLPTELAVLRRLAESALARKDFRAARSALLVALSVDDSDAATRVMWARLLTATGGGWRARRAWLGAGRLDTERQFRAEIEEALDRRKIT